MKYKMPIMMHALMLSSVAPGPATAQIPHGQDVGTAMPIGSRPGNPIFQLPQNARLISAFGERPAFSPDGKKLAFIGRSYGDAYEYDLATGAVRNLTAHSPHNGFLRVHYLADGSLLLLGPRVAAATREATRNTAIELFWMDGAGTRPPAALGKVAWEGVAVSRSTNMIAWSEIEPKPASYRDMRATMTTSIKTAKLVVEDGKPRLVDTRQILVTTGNQCLNEPQDFMPGDKSLTMACYKFFSGPGGRINSIMSVELATGKVTEYDTPASLYGEVEGLFPDGKRTLVECSGDRSAGMDLCLLDLVGSPRRYTRLTRIMDYGRWKYGNPVVSPDSRTIATQIGSADVEDAGVGQGIVLMSFP